MTRMTNQKVAETYLPQIIEAYQLHPDLATRRQASKFRNEMGVVYKATKKLSLTSPRRRG